MTFFRYSTLLLLCISLGLSACSSSDNLARSQDRSGPDTVYVNVPIESSTFVPANVEAGRFDNGKMWTFDNPPLAYFNEEYGFQPDESWFEKARLGSLRLPNCSASFVSPNGLVMTNHHCAREHLSAIEKTGENFDENGFYATTLDEERRVEGLDLDQLIKIVDVTAEIRDVEAPTETVAEKLDARTSAIAAIEARLLDEQGGAEGGYQVEVIALYNGGQYSAYVFKVYNDVRMVMAPELALGYFGGDADNFTYPRYALDVSFLRVYADTGTPLYSPNYFPFSQKDLKEGDPVFLLGNPGSTNRQQTYAQLEHRRDHEEPFTIRLFESRIKAMRAFLESHPEQAKEMDLKNTIFSLENGLKAYSGQLKGLQDPVLMGRRKNTEEKLRLAIGNSSPLQSEYGELHEKLAALQEEKARTSPLLGAFVMNPSSDIYSNILMRSVMGYIYTFQKGAGVPEENLAGFKDQLLDLKENHPEYEFHMIKSRLEDMIHYLGNDDETVSQLLGGRSAVVVARAIVDSTALNASASFGELLDGDFMNSDDPAIVFGRLVGPKFIEMQQAIGPLGSAESELAEKIAEARFKVEGKSAPPDASFSLRISDGRVKSYSYNGTKAPAFTTIFGLLDRAYSHEFEYPWNLPTRWINAKDLNMSIPINFVSTADITGGSSGSPVLNQDLEVVGLAFDSNIEGLPGEFIYTDETARTVSVDARAIVEALDVVYDADRISAELVTGKMYKSEMEADKN